MKQKQKLSQKKNSAVKKSECKATKVRKGKLPMLPFPISIKEAEERITNGGLLIIY